MKAIVIFTICLLSLTFIGYSSEPVSNAEVYIKRIKSNELIAFQQSNNNGLVSFAKLKKGTYNIVVDIPKQKGKFATKQRNRNNSLMVGYHFDKRIYFLQDQQGYFLIKFSGIKKIANSNISPMNDAEKGKNNQSQIIIGKFEVKGNQGSLTMKIEALTGKSFEKSVAKAQHDTRMTIIKSS